MKRFILVLFLVLLSGGFVCAVDPVVGFTEDGYSYVGAGYWTRGGNYYTRNRVDWGEYVYRNCCRYYEAYYYYKYYPATPPVSSVSPTDPDFRVKLLEIAKQRDAIEGSIRKSAAQHNEFVEAVAALGLSGNFNWQGYGAAPKGYGSYQLGNFGANASTVYGYSSVADLYGQTDLNVLYQQSSKLAQNAQQLSGQATTDFADLVKQAGSNQGAVAEILAKGQAAAAVLNATKADPTVRVVNRAYTVQFGSDGQPVVTPVVPQVDKGAPLKVLVTSDCMACHGKVEPKGKLDLSNLSALTLEQKMNIVGRLVTKDPAKVMPRKPDGGPGVRWSGDKVKLFLE